PSAAPAAELYRSAAQAQGGSSAVCPDAGRENRAMSRTLGIGGALILAAGVFFPLFTFRLREQSNNPGHFGANPVALDPGREALRLRNMPRISDLLPFKRVVSPYNPEPTTHTVSSWAWGSVGMILLSAAAVTLVLACVGSWKNVLAIGCG